MNYDFLFRLCLCFLLSFLIGIERQYRRRIIGLRTTILVAIGSFLFVTFSFSVQTNNLTQVASQVVTGMGFLGAGVILKDGKRIRGLTTAATLWCDAAIGVLCAGGIIFEAIIGTIIILFSNIILLYINKLVNNISGSKESTFEFDLNISSNPKIADNLKKDIEHFFKTNVVTIENKSLKYEIGECILNYKFQIKNSNLNKLEMLEEKILSYKIRNFSLNKISEIKMDEFDE